MTISVSVSSCSIHGSEWWCFTHRHGSRSTKHYFRKTDYPTVALAANALYRKLNLDRQNLIIH